MACSSRILIIDDEDYLRRTLAMILRRAGYTVDLAASAKEAENSLQACSYELAFLDIKLQDRSGLELLPELRCNYPNMRVVILSAHDKLESLIEANQHGAFDYLLKPVDPPVILEKVREILAGSQQLQEPSAPTS
jgi:two-component system nitrogen regulation response regulator GlnG